jgi:hypothetical protein
MDKNTKIQQHFVLNDNSLDVSATALANTIAIMECTVSTNSSNRCIPLVTP